VMDIAGELEAMNRIYGVSAHLSCLEHDEGRQVPKWCAETTNSDESLSFQIRSDKSAEDAIVKLALALQVAVAHDGTVDKSSNRNGDNATD
jgi:hypothetical protein